MDTTVLPTAQNLLECLCEHIALVPDPPDKCELRTGKVVVGGVSLVGEDECCQGLAWVRVVSIFPSQLGFPEQDTAPLGSGCPPEWLSVIMEMGVLRCAPTGTTTALPTAAEWATAFANTMHDAAAMRDAFCCLEGGFEEKVLGVWEPLDVEGGCMGGIQTVTVWVPGCINC